MSGRPTGLAAVGVYGLLGLGVAFALLPILWGLSTAFKPLTEIHAVPPTWIPRAPTLANLELALLSPKFLRYVANTLVVVGLALVLSLGLAVHAAHAVVRHPFPGKSALMMALWATIMIPGVSIIVPLYLVAVDVGLYDTIWVLVLVFSAWLVPTLVWLLRGFVAAVPAELEEAARIDGCSRAGAFYRITLPLLRPGLLAGGVLVFLMIWNEFLIGYSLVLSDQNRIVQVGVYFFITETGIEYGPLMAAAIGSILPILVAYGLLQRAFIQGLTGGAVKG